MAIESYEKALAIKSTDLEIKKDLASCYHSKKNYIQALKLYDEILQAEPDDIDTKTNKAIALHALDRYEEAIVLYEQVLAVKADNTVKANLVKAIVSEGFVFLHTNNYSKAAEYFQKAVAKDTANDYAYYGLAKAYRGLEMNDKAGEKYKKAIALNPDETLYSNEYGEFIAALYNQNNDVSVVNDDELPEISLTDDGQMVKSNSETLAKNKDLILLGDENYRKKDYETALKNYQNALDINPNDEVTLLKMGNIYKLKNDNLKASELYKRAIVVNPDYTDGWFNLGLVYANDNNIAEAKKSFNKVIAVDPQYAYAYYALAIAAETENDKTEALKNYKLFLQYNKDAANVSQVQDKIRSLEK